MEPILTVDGVLVCGTRVLLIQRTKPPFEDTLVFPGGHVEEGETFEAAVVRELAEEVGVAVAAHDLQFLLELNDPSRDPRPGHTSAYVFWMHVDESTLAAAIAGSDARALHVVELDSLTPEQMGFDHYLAIVKLREVLTCK